MLDELLFFFLISVSENKKAGKHFGNMLYYKKLEYKQIKRLGEVNYKMSEADNYLEELDKITKEINATENKISKIKGRSDSLQDEVSEHKEELEALGHSFGSIQEIEDFKKEKEERIQSLINNYKSELSI